MALRLITAPTTEPITLAEAKLDLRVDASTDDALITRLITTAREAAEHFTERSLAPQTWEVTHDTWPSGGIVLPRPPITSVTSVKYLEAVAGTSTTLTANTDYVADTDSEPGRVVLAPNASWPDLYAVPNAVRVRYVAGYASAAAVPSALKDWMLKLIGSLYEYREMDVSAQYALERSPQLMGLLDRYRIWSI